MSNGIDTRSKLEFLDMQFISGELPYNDQCNNLTGEDCATKSDTITVVNGEDAKDADIKYGDQSSKYAVCVETELGKYYAPGSFTGNGKAGPSICIFDSSLASKVRKIKGEAEPTASADDVPAKPVLSEDKPETPKTGSQKAQLSHEERTERMREIGNDPRIVAGFNHLKGADRIEAFNFALAQVNAGLDIAKVVELTLKKIDELKLAAAEEN